MREDDLATQQTHKAGTLDKRLTLSLLEAAGNAYASNGGRRASTVWPNKSGLRCKMQEKTTWQASRRPKPAPWTRYRRWGHLEAVGKRLCVEWGSPSKSGFSRASPVLGEQVRFGRASTVCAADAREDDLATQQTHKADTLDEIPTLGESLRQWGNAYASNGARRASPV